ncbi:MAG: RNA-binding protein [Marinilabiliales bacterium]|nr:MAG: RNA-binding protein [Marinilabiliales bacterium]
MNIYVGNLDYRVDENALRSVFERFGNVDDVKVITDKYTGRSKGFGFVTMENNEDAQKAISELNGSTLENRDITVNEARPQKQY